VQFSGYHNDIFIPNPTDPNSPTIVNYAVIPLPPTVADAQDLGGFTGIAPANDPVLDDLTAVSSHELAESVTDPVDGLGWNLSYPWTDPNGLSQPPGAEIGDLADNVWKDLHGYAVQELYSISASSSVIEVDKPISIKSITSSTSAGQTTVTVTLHDTDNTYRMSGTLSDFTPTFTWGDGNTTTTGITGSTLGDGDFQFTATHDYSISQPNFSVTVDDVGGATTTSSQTLDLHNAVTFSALQSQTISYGQQLAVSGKLVGASSFPANETVSITIGTATGSVAINPDGSFSGTVDTSSLGASSTAYTITYSYAGDATNQTETDSSTTLTVNPALLTVTANNLSMLYGGTVPALTYQVSGLVNNDTSATFTGSLSTTATSSSSVNSYPITQGNLAATGNYTIGAFNGGTLSVKPALLTVTANNLSMFYGDTLPALTYQYTGLVNNDTSATFTGSLSTTATSSSSVNSYPITQGNLAATGNYTIGAFSGGTLSVKPALLTVTANNLSMSYGGAVPALTYQYTGLVNNDTSATFTGSLSTTATSSSSSVGTYDITQGTLAATGNYTIGTFTKGALTVTLPSQSVYVLNATARGALSASGNAVVKLPGGLYVDSSSASAIVVSGNAQVNVGGTVLVAGGVSVSGSAACTATGTPATTADPFGGLPLPSVSGLTNYGAVRVSGTSTQTLNPGVYTSIQVSGKASVTLTSGTYIIEGGGLSVSGNGSLTWNGVGNGVTIFNAGSQYNGSTDGGTFGSISLGGNGSITLSSPTTGAYAGVAIFESRANSKALALGGSGTVSITGAVYAAAANVGLSGNAQVTGSLVVSTLTLSGNTGAFQLASGSSSSYTASTCNWISNGILTVWAEDDTGNGLNSDQVNRLTDAMTYLNSALGSFGVSLSWAADAASADVTVHFATSTPEGDASAGVIGYTTPDNNVYFVTTWSYYNGSDPTQIAANQLDFQTLAIHELAHTVGLGESADANSVMYEYLAAGTVRRTFTDANLSLINTNSDRFMKFAAGFRVDARAFEETIVAGGSLATNAGLNLSPSGGELFGMLDNWTAQSDAVDILVAAGSTDEGMAAIGLHRRPRSR
jgi:hypothetical protein